ncbi:MAG: malectin domain-containing carbohydrate-binding protein [Vampirovibrionales bacterium]|nr:malectin domain-containing carbohydrate-binding protein [Vampirovibrionales bacterium]
MMIRSLPHRFLHHASCNDRTGKARVGVSLPEILISIALFSVAVVGIYLSTSNAQRVIIKGMQADVEAAIANMKIAEVNPYDVDVDTAYDAPATYTTGKQSYALPNGQVIYWTRAVTSANASGDVKQVNVYLYKKSTDSTPYRKFRKDIVLDKQSFILADPTVNATVPAYLKDVTGAVWTRMNRSNDATIASGDTHRAGPDPAINNPILRSDLTPATGTPNVLFWTYGLSPPDATPNNMIFYIPATQGQTYTIKLGYCECNAAGVGTRVMRVLINNTVVETGLDVRAVAGLNKAMVRQYKAQSMNLGSGVYGLKIDLDRNGSTNKPLLMNMQIERGTSQ